MSIESLTVESNVLHELRQSLLTKQRIIDRLEQEKISLEVQLRGLRFVQAEAAMVAAQLMRKLSHD
jgi:hypothetical protein